MLHYRMVGFSFPAVAKATSYKIEIARGFYNKEDSFKRNIVVSKTGNKNRIIAEVPLFGSGYSWRVVAENGKTVVFKGGFKHFHTLYSPAVDTNIRLRVLHTAERYKDGYVFLDNNGVLYDMNGHPVWFLPPSLGTNLQPLDLKVSPKGTITFLLNDKAYEINYNGDILWKAPDNGIVSGAATEGYHHQFSRLHNGNYMLLGMEEANVLQRLPAAGSRDPLIIPNNKLKGDKRDTIYQKAQFGTIIEYGPNGNVVWSWRSAADDHLTALYGRVLSDENSQRDMHENSFFFDEQNKVIYVSFRVPGLVAKINYTDGKILASYGNVSRPGVKESGSNFFSGQHSCGLSQKGYLYLYNNNACDDGCIPKITMMQEPANDKDTLKIIWEYNCTTDDMTKDYDIMKNRLIFRSGGSVTELPDNSMFVSMAQPYSELFILGQDKHILWSALPEKLDPGQTKWQIIPQYRASMINNADEMEHLVWGEEPGK
jgi:hypothetical protein